VNVPVTTRWTTNSDGAIRDEDLGRDKTTALQGNNCPWRTWWSINLTFTLSTCLGPQITSSATSLGLGTKVDSMC